MSRLERRSDFSRVGFFVTSRRESPQSGWETKSLRTGQAAVTQRLFRRQSAGCRAGREVRHAQCQAAKKTASPWRSMQRSSFLEFAMGRMVKSILALSPKAILPSCPRHGLISLQGSLRHAPVRGYDRSQLPTADFSEGLLVDFILVISADVLTLGVPRLRGCGIVALAPQLRPSAFRAPWSKLLASSPKAILPTRTCLDTKSKHGISFINNSSKAHGCSRRPAC